MKMEGGVVSLSTRAKAVWDGARMLCARRRYDTSRLEGEAMITRQMHHKHLFKSPTCFVLDTGGDNPVIHVTTNPSFTR